MILAADTDVIAKIVDTLISLGPTGFLVLGGAIVYLLMSKGRLNTNNNGNGKSDALMINLLADVRAGVKAVQEQQTELALQRQELTILNQSLHELVKRFDQMFLQRIK